MIAKGIITVASEKGKKLEKAGKLATSQLEDTSLYHLVPVNIYGSFSFEGEEFIINESSVYPNCFLCTHKKTGLLINRKGEPFPKCGSPREAVKQGKLILTEHLIDLRMRFQKYEQLKERVLEAYGRIKQLPQKKNRQIYLELFKKNLV